MVGRRVGVLAGLAACALSALIARPASANPMDLAPERLKTCDAPTPDGCGKEPFYYRPDNAAWAKLVTQYAMAIAPTAMHPARTTGYGGFEFSLFGQMTTTSNPNGVLNKGTEGAISEGKKYPSQNGSPDSTLQLYGVMGRKGLPYGFELQGSVGYLANTELVALGGGIRLAPFEGFRKWFDVSVGGYVNTLTGTSKVKITVPALDVQVSRNFVLSNQVILTPYVGWQMVWINADSGVVDATPQTDALKNCNARTSSPDERAAGDTGEFRCQDRPNNAAVPTGDAAAGTPQAATKLDLNNNMVFKNIRGWQRQRAMIGLSIRWENLHAVIPHVMMELQDPEAGEPAPKPGEQKRLAGLEKQWTFGALVGLSW